MVKEFCGSKRWKPEFGFNYWLIHPSGTVDFIIWDGGRTDMWNYRSCNCFRTKEEAEQKLAYINALAEINEYIAENERKYAKDKSHRYMFEWSIEEKHFYPKFISREYILATNLIVESQELAIDLIANQSHNLRVVAGVK